MQLIVDNVKILTERGGPMASYVTEVIHMLVMSPNISTAKEVDPAPSSTKNLGMSESRLRCLSTVK